MRLFTLPLGALVLALAFCGASLFVSNRPHVIPERESFALFPMNVGKWHGTRDEYSRQIIEALKLHDYLLANYQGPEVQDRVNLYIAYYQTQSMGSAAHSPRTCIPGDGWEIESLTRSTIPMGASSLTVNRAVIAKGQVRQLVYYWFDQRGRVLASEYRVKWYLFVDGLTKRRTDGALIRLVSPVEGRDIAGADKRLQQYLVDLHPRLGAFLPR